MGGLRKSLEKPLRTFLEVHKRERDVDTLSQEDFVKLLEADEQRFLRDTFAGASPAVPPAQPAAAAR